MKSFVTYEELRSFNKNIEKQTILEKAMKTFVTQNTFLSYSSKDLEFVPAIIKILENHGTNVYIDRKDGRLSGVPNEETGRILKDSIKKCRRFVVFVTNNSKDSTWIPWELGLADGSKGSDYIALFPSAEKSYEQSWSEQEYLGIYQRIIWGNFANSDPEWLVYYHHNNTAVRLSEWLNK
jgi:hypothetical protein